MIKYFANKKHFLGGHYIFARALFAVLSIIGIISEFMCSKSLTPKMTKCKSGVASFSSAAAFNKGSLECCAQKRLYPSLVKIIHFQSISPKPLKKNMRRHPTVTTSPCYTVPFHRRKICIKMEFGRRFIDPIASNVY